MGPERFYIPFSDDLRLIPKRHFDTLREPRKQVVMDSAAFLEFSDPEIPT